MRYIIPLLSAALAAAACTPTQPSPQVGPAPGAQGVATTAPPTTGATAGAMTPSADAIARANKWGVAAVAPGSGVAGPFLAADGTLLWADGAGRLTMYLPEHPVIVLAQQNGQHAQHRYVVLPHGNFAVDAAGQATALAQPLPEMNAWPHLEQVATSMVAVLQAMIARGHQVPPAGSAVPYELMSELSRRQHETTMSIVDNIGGAGCTERYDADTNAYLGCW